VRTETTSRRDAVTVAGWRRRQLTESGFPERLAATIAKDPRYDLHALIELVDRGCPPELADRIMAPLEEERAT
jgi:hypothetical protein